MWTTPSVFSKPHLAVAAWFAIWISGSHAANAPAPPVPLDAYGRLPALEDVSVSPDGDRIAFVKTLGDERYLVVTELNHPAPTSGVQIGNSKLRSVEWIDNGHLLISVSETTAPGFVFRKAFEWWRLLTFDVKTGSLRRLSFSIMDEITYDIVGGGATVRNVNGEPTLFVPGWAQRSRNVVAALYEFSGDRHAKIVDTSRQGGGWLLDQSGRVAALWDYDNDRQKWEIMTRDGGSDRLTLAASGTAALDIPQMIGFSANGDAIIVEFVENGDPVWKPLLKDHAWGEPLEHGAAFGRPIEGRTSGRIVGAMRGVEDPTYVFFDNEVQAHWNAVLRAFPGEHVHLMSTTDDFSKIIVRLFGAKDGYAYALYEWYGHRATILGPVYDGLNAPAEVRPVSYAAGDGLLITGFLTLPKGVLEKSLPLVVLPHGGPAAADTLNFDWWAQALANEGYAVLQPNYRGSALSYKHESAGFGEWGRKMQTDLSDGVRYLAAKGLIDPKRVCIVGASYGGYAALAGVTLDTGVYRCAVSVAGLSDLRRLLRTTFTGSSNVSQRYWDRFLGITDPNDSALLAISPIEHVARVTVPVLLIHGRDDTVVPYDQSEVMLKALKQAGKPAELVTLQDEDHWLSRGKTRLQMLQACVAFLKANNPPN